MQEPTTDGTTGAHIPPARRPTLGHLGLFSAATILLVIIAPFNTASELTLAERVVYWFTLIFGGAAISFTISNLFLAWTSRAVGVRFVILRALQVLTASLPISLLVVGMELWLRDRAVHIEHWPVLLIYVVAITAAVTSVSSLVEQRRVLREQLGVVERIADGASNVAAPAMQTPFHRRLDPGLRESELQMIKAEDHYLRVTTSKGTELIRCSLSAAVDELAELDGKQVHRSFWVAHDAILGVKRHGNAYRLILRDDATVPLSRRRYRELSKEGWLPD
ncbi:MAG: LytTR family DNA-binding domain-containing protein [Pseudomonadota bacterium]